MPRLLLFSIFSMVVTLFCLNVSAQDSTGVQLPGAYLDRVGEKADALSGKLDKHTEKSLSVLEKQEARIRRKLAKTDSLKAVQVFASADKKYGQLEQKLHKQAGKFSSYIPYLDTVKASFKFIEENRQYLTKVKDAGSKLEGARSNVKELENSMAAAEQVKIFIKERKEYLRNQLSSLPFSKELKQINKLSYYYSAQINEYKQTLKDQKKMERKALELLSKTKAFQEFMSKNSQLASMFRLPGSDDGSGGASLAGLQTRAQVNQMIQDKVGTGGSGAQEVFRKNLGDAKSQLSQLKDKVMGAGGGSSEQELPDFKPNSQKTKSFLKRLEYGSNIQTDKARNYFPVTTQIGLSVGYKLNDKSMVGVGASYGFGLGNGWNNIKLSHQGVGLRSFVDYKLKGSYFLSGGYEQNYRTLFTSLEQLKNYSAWQSSGLIGINKKYKVSKKMKGSMQLLWDFLSYQQVPRTQSVVFRVGYNIK